MFQDLIFFVLFVLKSCTYSFADYKLQEKIAIIMQNHLEELEQSL